MIMQNDKFLEDLLWTSYRYCIGRHSYVTTYAKDMGDYFYDKLSDETKEHNAEDIRQQIADQLQFSPFNFGYDYSVRREDRRPLEDFLEFINSLNVTSSEELSDITNVEAYIEDGKLNYAISRKSNAKYDNKVYEMDFMDLLPWADLASLFDVKNHKMVTMRNADGKEETVECYESYINDSNVISTEGNYVTLTSIPWKYKKVYRPVEYGVSNRSCNEDCIIKIENK
jgi:hypothetical protein